MKNLLSLQEHAYYLSKVIIQFSERRNSPDHLWHLASEWLHLGSSITSMNIVTEQFDDAIMFCGPAIEYEDKKSQILENIVTQLSLFNFFWGAFENIAKAMDIPKVPNSLKKRRTLIDDCLFFLKNDYPLISAPETYNHFLHQLENLLDLDPQYAHTSFKKIVDEEYCDNAGRGLALIRVIRNDFAHGSHSFPEPDDWSWENNFTSADYGQKIHISSRLLLLTIQMLLISFFKDKPFEVLEWGTSEDYINVIDKLFNLHLITAPRTNFGLFYSSMKVKE